MFSIPHIVIIFIVVLVVFGPHKLPELARNLGKMMAEFRKASTDFKMAFEEEMRTIERQAREAELKKVQEAAAASAAAEPATLATPADTATERILPPTVEVVEPTITSVNESVAREPRLFEEPPNVDEPPITEGTAPEHQNAAETPSPETSSKISEAGTSPAHDQQQPA